MLKSIVSRTLIPVGLTVTGFVVLCFILLYTGIKDVITRDSIGHATNLADTVLKSAHYAMLKSDRDTLTAIVHNVGEQEGVEHVRIFTKAGVINVSSKQDELGKTIDKKTEGCIMCHTGTVPATSLGRMDQARTYRNKAGEEVMAITTPIYNEPQCSNAACHFHPPSQKVLGTLDIGLSQDMRVTTLASIRNQMFIFSIMILFLTVGGVTALLRRSVFLPMQKLSDLTEQAEEDNGMKTPPPQFPVELDRIAKSYYNLNLKLNQAQEELGTIRKGTAGQQ